MTTEPDRPPVRIVAPTRDRKPRETSGRKKSLVKPLEELFTTVGTVVYAINAVDGQAIIQGAPRLAKALNEAAKDNAALYRNLERMLTGSTWGGVIVAAGAIALPILSNHGLLPFQIPGLTPEESGAPIPDISGTAISESMPPESANSPDVP